jgi:hypothetical protein
MSTLGHGVERVDIRRPALISGWPLASVTYKLPIFGSRLAYSGYVTWGLKSFVAVSTSSHDFVH